MPNSPPARAAHLRHVHDHAVHIPFGAAYVRESRGRYEVDVIQHFCRDLHEHRTDSSDVPALPRERLGRLHDAARESKTPQFRRHNDARYTDYRVQILLHGALIPAVPRYVSRWMRIGSPEQHMPGLAHHQGHLQVDVPRGLPARAQLDLRVHNGPASAN